MPRYIGLDVHTQSTTAVVLDASGKKLREALLETHAEVLTDFVRSVAPTRHLCMEEGSLCGWLYEVLEPVVDELVVVQPPKHRGNKSDSRDAHARAEDLRLARLEGRVYKDPRAFRELREAVQAERVCQRDLVRVKTRLHALARSRGLDSRTARRLYDGVERREVLALFPQHTARRVKIWCDQLDGLLDQHEQAELWMFDVAQRTDAVRRLMTAPGIGPKRAAQIVATMITPWRFRTKRQLWSYSGLGVVTRSSSDWVQDEGAWERKQVPQTRGLNKNFHPMMKDAFKGAAHIVVGRMKTHPLRAHYDRLTASGTRPNLAKLTIARRIAAAVLAMWKNKEDYDPDRHRR